ncbi:hypothetical protein [Bacillus sp. 0102A]|uniref:hypothetical protein n=1 Tax=Bacillus sp. 0102A TaxID=3120563 RepID=UPI002FDA9C27
MAKLEGVKTLDMVNGEITKIAYDGAEYERVEGEAQAGDLALALESGLDTTAGAYYSIMNPIDAGFIYRDNTNESHYWGYDGTFVIFRKIVATNPSVEERVAKTEGEIESLKSDVAALKGEAEYKRIGKDEARAGDYVKYIDSDYLDICDYTFTIGKLYEIKSVDEDGDFEHEADDGERLMACPDDEELEFYRKVAAKPKPERLKVGDYAKVVGNVSGHYAEINEIVIVKRDDRDSVPFLCGKLNGNGGGIFCEDELVRATDEEVAEAKDEAARAKFKKGAKVRLLSGGGENPLNGFENGKIYEVTDNNFDHTRGKRIRLDGGDCLGGFGFATPDQLEILSEEEAAKLEREAAERKKWAEIGREVGEYKVGDIFRNPDGILFEITRIDDRLAFPIRFTNLEGADDGYMRKASLTLITPVEARFDR